MSGVVAKMFVSTVTHGVGATNTTMYKLGVVCRGEINKDWAAATPSGAMEHGSHPVLDEVFNSPGSKEVLVYQIPDDDGEWSMKSCDFTYNGCKVLFTRTPPKDGPWGEKLELTINALPATKVLREAYATGLLSGTPPSFRIEIAPAIGDE